MSERELLMQAIAKVERHEGKDSYYNSHNQAELMVAIAKFLLWMDTNRAVNEAFDNDPNVVMIRKALEK